mgnify:CR=1 FL=1
MRKEIWLLCLPLLLLGGCGTQEKAQDPPQIITRKTVQEAKKAETSPAVKEPQNSSGGQGNTGAGRNTGAGSAERRTAGA